MMSQIRIMNLHKVGTLRTVRVRAICFGQLLGCHVRASESWRVTARIQSMFCAKKLALYRDLKGIWFLWHVIVRHRGCRYEHLVYVHDGYSLSRRAMI